MLGEGSFINIKFGLSQASAGREITGRIRDRLYYSLSRNVILNFHLQGGIAIREAVDQIFESQSGVPSPSIPIWRYSSALVKEGNPIAIDSIIPMISL